MNKGTIYMIKCKDSEIKECYVGSTKNLKQRIRCHKSNCNNLKRQEYNYKLYKYIRDNGNFDNFEFEILEEVEFKDDNEKFSIERYYVEEFKATLNKDIPGRTKKEYYDDNKEQLSEKKKEYYKENQEKLKNYALNHRKANIEKIRAYDRGRNKERSKIKMTCECGSTFRKRDKSTHEKTEKHTVYNFLNNIEKSNIIV